MTESLPLNINIFALFIFLGTVQGIFLSYFFLNKYNRQVKANIFLGLLLLAASIIGFDILISYTNFMFRVIYLVDASEPFNFLIGPMFYLYVVAKLDETRLKKVYYHFIPFFIYLVYSILFLVQSIESKYNAYLDQYHPEMDYVPVTTLGFEDPVYIKSIINELTILSIAAYLIFAIIRLYRTSRTEQHDEKRKRLFSLLWVDCILMSIVLAIIIFVKLYFTNDLGDYIIITAVTVFIYSISFKVVRDSIFFQKGQFEKKYSKSVLDEENKQKISEKIINYIEGEKYYLGNSPSLHDLAEKINTSPNYVSQVINEKLKLTFPELISKYRIEEAKRMLEDPYSNETIEGIAYSVGYSSKSTFHSAFKKFTGQTPAEYKASLNN
jgi:AraC-like DNA-binding protein